MDQKQWTKIARRLKSISQSMQQGNVNGPVEELHDITLEARKGQEFGDQHLDFVIYDAIERVSGNFRVLKDSLNVAERLNYYVGQIDLIVYMIDQHILD